MANGWRRRPGRQGSGRRVRWPLGCLLVLVLLVVILVVLSVLFGGFRLGTRADGPTVRPTASAAVNQASGFA